MNVLVMTALDTELTKLLEIYKPAIFFKTPRITVWHTLLAHTNLYFAVSGVGPKNIRHFFELYFRLNINADLVISTGFAGALNAGFAVGDMVNARYYIHNYTQPKNAAAEAKNQNITLPETGLKLPAKYQGLTGIGVDRIVMLPEKIELKKKFYGVDFVDMESYEIASICHKNNIKTAVFRVISDTLDFKFPPEEFLRGKSVTNDIPKFIFRLLVNPLSIIRIFRYRKNIKKASEALSRELDLLIKNNFTS